MGHSRWSDAAYQARQWQRRTGNQTAFTYDQDVRSSGVLRVHDLMNPYGKTRESRDSLEHPESLAIAVIFDVTGSMGEVPRVLQTKLGALMRLLVQHGYVEHPQILFGAVGDAHCDLVPIQIGQFESGLEMDDDLGRIVLEGGGGGQVHESYELALYFAARHTSIDCYERRGRKGYLFTIGDEKPYPKVLRSQVHTYFGDRLKADIPVERIIAEVRQRYEHFHIIPTNTSHGESADVQQHWRNLIGERALLLNDETAVCETIALTIGLCEGKVEDIAAGVADMVQAGYDAGAAANASAALTRYAATQAPLARSVVGLPPAVVAGDDGRL